MTLSAYREMSLMCADHKIFAKVLGNRLKRVIERVIHQGQFGIPGWSMRAGHGRIRDFLESCQGGGDLGYRLERSI